MKKLIALTAAVLATAVLFAAEPKSGAIDKNAFDSIVSSGITASDAEIAESEWASAVRKAGVLRVGGTRTSYLFSQLDETDNRIRGFDAGLYQLLARYILGDASKYELTQVNSSTRESVLRTGQVDCVFATYSITPARQEVISFAGPYYVSKQAILVKNKGCCRPCRQDCCDTGRIDGPCAAQRVCAQSEGAGIRHRSGGPHSA